MGCRGCRSGRERRGGGRARIELRYAGERNRFGDRVGLERHPAGAGPDRREGSARGGGGGAGRGGGEGEADDGDGEAGEAPRAS